MDARISREGLMMGAAQLMAYRGTCSRLRVGAVFGKDGRIIVTGYNGAPRGMPHCTHQEYYMAVSTPNWAIPNWVPENATLGQHWYWDGQTASTSPACTVAEHAERNAIVFAAREGISLLGTTLYVTHAPCLDCSRMLLNVGVEGVYYETPYRLTQGIDLLKQRGIPVVAWQPIG